FRGTSDFDVIVGNRSDVSVTTVPFAARIPQSQQKSTLKEVITMPPGKKVSLVEAKVVSLCPSARTVNVRGAEREVRHCNISDGTAQITLQLWERQMHLVQLHSTYAFTELSTRTFEGKTQLTTSLNSTCSPIRDLAIPDCAVASAEARLSSIDSPIHGLEIRSTMKCSLCGKRQDTLDTKTKFHRCQQCRMMQKTTNYNRQLSATLKLSADGEDYTLTASHFPLTSYLERYDLQSLNNVEELEEHFLGLQTVCVSFDDELHVTHIMQPAATSPISPEAHHSGPTTPR
ncbi:hypothetical protein NFI96_030843, partial [Prochilodus magdalenae]